MIQAYLLTKLNPERGALPWILNTIELWTHVDLPMHLLRCNTRERGSDSHP